MGGRHTAPWCPCTRASSTRSPTRSPRNGSSASAHGSKISGVRAEAPRKISGAPVEWPHGGVLSRDWVLMLGEVLDTASRRLQPQQLPTVLPVPVVDAIVTTAERLLNGEPNCLKIDPEKSCTSVVLVGDVHGQLHDVLHLLEITGYPGSDQIYVFNGDYVDRGAWGFETYILLLAWKVLLPKRVFLLRGNHETRFCNIAYGFEEEVIVKYGDDASFLYEKILASFEALPLAAVVASSVYVAHGGLFRHCQQAPVLTPGTTPNSSKRFMDPESRSLKLGTLEDLAKATRGVLDPSGVGHNAVPGDVLWSDPSPNPGLEFNAARGIGLLFGPDCTQEFLQKHRLKLIVRSHEGPDAREKRTDMKSMDNGYTIDHVVDAGKLITLFSAPDYPQFQARSRRHENKGAYIVLEPPSFSKPHYHTFEAIIPRPQVQQ
ncbi:hypothetical protein O6H91_08G075400 [Diphasiastrum complanatum]|uniref:Uncharacterized protein n=2 Tax=Diphasiastrum complanatum TaxID=34168 RepID=A0ACC2CYZ5_DIPCM|nr:hypothetical protein O6H91_08G075000 [Diphasiastrum complanatum]KAJ7547219.1 hypothetical protein O6H91_08G075400 [Diphasiastrum complanatum]